MQVLVLLPSKKEEAEILGVLEILLQEDVQHRGSSFIMIIMIIIVLVEQSYCFFFFWNPS